MQQIRNNILNLFTVIKISFVKVCEVPSNAVLDHAAQGRLIVRAASIAVLVWKQHEINAITPAILRVLELWKHFKRIPMENGLGLDLDPSASNS